MLLPQVGSDRDNRVCNRDKPDLTEGLVCRDVPPDHSAFLVQLLTFFKIFDASESVRIRGKPTLPDDCAGEFCHKNFRDGTCIAFGRRDSNFDAPVVLVA